MKNPNENLVQITRKQRRRFLQLFGTAAALLPVTMITGCSEDKPPAPANSARSSEPEPPARQSPAAEAEATQQDTMESAEEPAQDSVEQVAEDTTDQATAAPEKVSLDDPTAKALGYKHDAANVDFEKYPQRAKPQASNHYCNNCTLFQGGQGDQWAPCTLFQGKLVNGKGWCSGYTPKPA